MYIFDTIKWYYHYLRNMKPPYEITSQILNLVASISEKIGEVKSAKLIKPRTELRKKNRIKTIQ